MSHTKDWIDPGHGAKLRERLIICELLDDWLKEPANGGYSKACGTWPIRIDGAAAKGKATSWLAMTWIWQDIWIPLWRPWKQQTPAPAAVRLLNCRATRPDARTSRRPTPDPESRPSTASPSFQGSRHPSTPWPLSPVEREARGPARFVGFSRRDRVAVRSRPAVGHGSGTPLKAEDGRDEAERAGADAVIAEQGITCRCW